MSPEEKSLLERTYKMVEENNTILKSIRSSNRWSLFLRILYWVIIIGISFGAYYFIQPYMEMLLGVSGKLGAVNDMPGLTSQLQDLLK